MTRSRRSGGKTSKKDDKIEERRHIVHEDSSISSKSYTGKSPAIIAKKALRDYKCMDVVVLECYSTGAIATFDRDSLCHEKEEKNRKKERSYDRYSKMEYLL